MRAPRPTTLARTRAPAIDDRVIEDHAAVDHGVLADDNAVANTTPANHDRRGRDLRAGVHERLT